jgi:hypothetical protein
MYIDKDEFQESYDFKVGIFRGRTAKDPTEVPSGVKDKLSFYMGYSKGLREKVFELRAETDKYVRRSNELILAIKDVDVSIFKSLMAELKKNKLF